MECEWPTGGEEWEQKIIDPTEFVGSFARTIASMAARYEKAGTIGIGGYWAEPPRGLRAVELLNGYKGLCAERKHERAG